MSKFLTVAFLAAAICTLPSSSNAATIDFDDFVPTAVSSESQPGALTELTGSVEARFVPLTVAWKLTRPNSFFDIIAPSSGAGSGSGSGAGPTFPFGPSGNSLSPFSDPGLDAPFKLSFDRPVSRVSFLFGDFGGDAFDRLRMQAFPNENAVGQPIAFETRTVGRPGFGPASDFTGNGISISANDNIRSVLFQGGTSTFPNSVYYNDIDVTPVPLPASVSSTLAGIALFGGLAVYRRRIKRA